MHLCTVYLTYVEFNLCRNYKCKTLFKKCIVNSTYLPFTGHIYVVVAPKNNEWGFDYWLAHCLEGKQNLLEPVIDDENIEFPTGSMVIKGE